MLRPFLFLLMLAFVSPLTALAEGVSVAPADTSVSPWQMVLYTLAVALAGIVASAIRAGGKAVERLLDSSVKNTNLREALRLVNVAAVQGASVAWSTYTKALKEGREDGKLTPEEAKEARERALSAALASLGQAGQEFVKTTLQDGFYAAMETALERAYNDVRPFTGAGLALPPAGLNDPAPVVPLDPPAAP